MSKIIDLHSINMTEYINEIDLKLFQNIIQTNILKLINIDRSTRISWDIYEQLSWFYISKVAWL